MCAKSQEKSSCTDDQSALFTNFALQQPQTPHHERASKTILCHSGAQPAPAQLRLRHGEKGDEIFDPLRGKWLVLTP